MPCNAQRAAATTTAAGDSLPGTRPGAGTRIIAAARRAKMLERVTPENIAECEAKARDRLLYALFLRRGRGAGTEERPARPAEHRGSGEARRLRVEAGADPKLFMRILVDGRPSARDVFLV